MTVQEAKKIPLHTECEAETNLANVPRDGTLVSFEQSLNHGNVDGAAKAQHEKTPTFLTAAFERFALYKALGMQAAALDLFRRVTASHEPATKATKG